MARRPDLQWTASTGKIFGYLLRAELRVQVFTDGGVRFVVWHESESKYAPPTGLEFGRDDSMIMSWKDWEVLRARIELEHAQLRQAGKLKA